MANWIDLPAVLRILALAVVLGAGLPALFGIGLRLLAPSENRPHAIGAERTITARPGAVATATLCFAVVVAAIGWGIYLIVAGT